MKSLRGVIPILVTPFHEDGTIDENSVETQVEYLFEHGAVGIGIGYGSEIDFLSEEEQAQLTTRVALSSSGRGHVVANVLMGPTKCDTIRALNDCMEKGATVALLRPSSYRQETEEEIADAIVEAVDAAGFPTILQDAPQHTGVHLSADTIITMFQNSPLLIAAKVEPPDPLSKIRQIAEALAPNHGVVIGGRGGHDLVREICAGATSTMPGPAFTKSLGEIIRLVTDGNLEEALSIWFQLLPYSVVADRNFSEFIFVHKILLRKRNVIRSSSLKDVKTILSTCTEKEIDTFIKIFGDFE